MKIFPILSFLLLQITLGKAADNRFLIPANNVFFQSSQISVKEVVFEVDKSGQSTVIVMENGSITIECDELTLNGDITFKNADVGENTSGIKIEIYYKKLSGNGKIINGITGYKGGVSFIFKSK